jgi:hypothetical protein
MFSQEYLKIERWGSSSIFLMSLIASFCFMAFSVRYGRLVREFWRILKSCLVDCAEIFREVCRNLQGSLQKSSGKSAETFREV